jgi:LDH2 family malate/lactate/ureidoglycolate dehydrogenase
MKVQIDTAKKMIAEIYTCLGVDPAMIDWLVELSLEMDLEGNFFSGFGEVPEVMQKDFSPELHETFDVDKPSLKLINGNGKDARLIMKDLIPKAVIWAREQGQIFMGFKNCGYHENLSTIARKFAEQDIVCMYSSNGGPQGVVPYGGTKDMFGTNPVAYGIPTSDMPIVFDAATATRAYGTIGHARERGEQLPADIYLDVRVSIRPTRRRRWRSYRSVAIKAMLLTYCSKF